MPLARIELALPHENGILNPARLPIPPEGLHTEFLQLKVGSFKSYVSKLKIKIFAFLLNALLGDFAIIMGTIKLDKFVIGIC